MQLLVVVAAAVVLAQEDIVISQLLLSYPSTAVLVEKPASDSLRYSHCYYLHYY
jgi:hypothetical protein